MRRTHNNCRHYRRFSFLHVMSWRCPADQKSGYSGNEIAHSPKIKNTAGQDTYLSKVDSGLADLSYSLKRRDFFIIIDFRQ